MARTGQRLELPALLADEMRQHAQASGVEECCGILLGVREGDGARVRAVRPATNIEVDSPRTRYVMAPEDLLAAHREARQGGLEVVGYYHSHPGQAPRPSPRDLDNAWSGTSYVILGREPGDDYRIRSWQLAGDPEDAESRAFVEDSVVIVETAQ